MNILTITNSTNTLKRNDYPMFSFKGKVPISVENGLTEKTLQIASASIASIASVCFINSYKLSKEQQAETIESFKNGASYKELAEKNHCRPGLIAKLICRQSNAKEIIAQNKANTKAKIKCKNDVVLTQEQIDEIIKLYISGLSMRKIAAQKEVSSGIIWKVINLQPNAEELKLQNRAGIKPNKRSSAYLPEYRKKIIELYVSGMTKAEIASFLNVSNVIVKHIIEKRRDAKILKSEHMKNKLIIRESYTPEQENEILDLYRNGLNITLISKLLNESFDKVSKVISKQENIKILKSEFLANRIFVAKDFLPEEESEIINMFQNGEKVGAIAKHFGCSYYSILNVIIGQDNAKQIIQNNRLKVMGRNLPQEIQEKIIEMYINQTPRKKIAKELKCSLPAVSTVISNHPEVKEIRTNQKRKNFSEDEKTQIIAMYIGGFTHKDIAKKLNCSIAVVSNFLNNLENIKELKSKHRESRQSYTKEQIDEMVRLFVDKKMSLSQIAKEKGCCKATVFKHLKTRINTSEVIQNETDAQRIVRKRKISPEEVNKVLDLNNMGYKPSQISQMTNISHKSILMILKKQNIG